MVTTGQRGTMKQGVGVEVKVFIDVFKLCTFSTDQIKESVGEIYLCIVGDYGSLKRHG